jgi:hypothetical protein
MHRAIEKCARHAAMSGVDYRIIRVTIGTTSKGKALHGTLEKSPGILGVEIPDCTCADAPASG